MTLILIILTAIASFIFGRFITELKYDNIIKEKDLEIETYRIKYTTLLNRIKERARKRNENH